MENVVLTGYYTAVGITDQLKPAKQKCDAKTLRGH
jgi:hypothetical protein